MAIIIAVNRLLKSVTAASSEQLVQLFPERLRKSSDADPVQIYDFEPA